MKATWRYLSPRQMAEMTGLNERAIRRAIVRGDLPAIRMGGGRKGGMWVREEVFKAWLLREERGHGQAGTDA